MMTKALTHNGARWQHYPIKHDNGRYDARYTITPEYDGSPNRRYILRFCDDYISGHDTPRQAFDAAQQYHAKRIEGF